MGKKMYTTRRTKNNKKKHLGQNIQRTTFNDSLLINLIFSEEHWLGTTVHFGAWKVSQINCCTFEGKNIQLFYQDKFLRNT